MPDIGLVLYGAIENALLVVGPTWAAVKLMVTVFVFDPDSVLPK